MGSWILAELGICLVEEVELWVFVHEMRLAWKTGSKCIQVETDYLVMVNWLGGI